jgi:hypothetical protein
MRRPLAVGLEVTTRVGLAFEQPEYLRRAWHSPGVTGPFGGAASAGRLLKLDTVRQTYALGLAGSQAAGTYAQLGTPGIKFQQSRGRYPVCSRREQRAAASPRPRKCFCTRTAGCSPPMDRDQRGR